MAAALSVCLIDYCLCQPERQRHACTAQAVDKGYTRLRVQNEFGAPVRHFSVNAVPDLGQLQARNVGELVQVVEH